MSFRSFFRRVSVAAWVENPGRAAELDPEGSWGSPADHPSAWLNELFAVEPEHYFRRVPGRDTFGWCPAGALGLLGVVKRFRGDAWHDVWFARLRGLPRRSPARREAESLIALRNLGLPVPRPYLWVEERRGGAAARSVVVMEHIEHRETLAEALGRSSPAESRRWVVPLARLVARLHAGGWYHRDLYLQHWILREEGSLPHHPDLPSPSPQPLSLLDLGRARRQSRARSRWFVKDLAALAYSLPSPARTGSLGPRFLRAYLTERGLTSRGDLRAWATRIEAKRRRIAAHVPRHVWPTAVPAAGGE